MTLLKFILLTVAFLESAFHESFQTVIWEKLNKKAISKKYNLIGFYKFDECYFCYKMFQNLFGDLQNEEFNKYIDMNYIQVDSRKLFAKKTGERISVPSTGLTLYTDEESFDYQQLNSEIQKFEPTLMYRYNFKERLLDFLKDHLLFVSDIAGIEELNAEFLVNVFTPYVYYVGSRLDYGYIKGIRERCKDILIGKWISDDALDVISRSNYFPGRFLYKDAYFIYQHTYQEGKTHLYKLILLSSVEELENLNLRIELAIGRNCYVNPPEDVFWEVVNKNSLVFIVVLDNFEERQAEINDIVNLSLKYKLGKVFIIILDNDNTEIKSFRYSKHELPIVTFMISGLGDWKKQFRIESFFNTTSELEKFINIQIKFIKVYKRILTMVENKNLGSEVPEFVN